MTSYGLTSGLCSPLHPVYQVTCSCLKSLKVTEFSEAHMRSDMLGEGSEAFGIMSLKSGGHSSGLFLLHSSPNILMGLSWDNCSSQKA